MQFSVQFYVNRQGACPVQVFLDALKESDPGDCAVLVAGLYKLRESSNHRAPLSKPLGGGLFELRHVGKLNSRVLYFFMHGRRIVAVHGIRSRSRKIAARDVAVAAARMKDWLSRSE
jgi:phage-related protein